MATSTAVETTLFAVPSTQFIDELTYALAFSTPEAVRGGEGDRIGVFFLRNEPNTVHVVTSDRRGVAVTPLPVHGDAVTSFEPFAIREADVADIVKFVRGVAGSAAARRESFVHVRVAQVGDQRTVSFDVVNAGANVGSKTVNEHQQRVSVKGLLKHIPRRADLDDASTANPLVALSGSALRFMVAFQKVAAKSKQPVLITALPNSGGGHRIAFSIGDRYGVFLGDRTSDDDGLRLPDDSSPDVSG